MAVEISGSAQHPPWTAQTPKFLELRMAVVGVAGMTVLGTLLSLVSPLKFALLLVVVVLIPGVVLAPLGEVWGLQPLRFV